MDIAKIKVTGAKAITAYVCTITKGMAGAQVQVEYNDPIWDGLDKQIVFRAGESTINADGNMVPPELLRRSGDTLWVGVYGCNEDGSVQIPTVWTSLGTIQPGANPEGDASAKPTLPVYRRLEQQMRELSQKVDGMEIPEVDNTLSIGGAAADAKAVGDRLTALENRQNGGYIGTYVLTLKADAWKEAAVPDSKYEFVCDVEVAGVKSEHVPVGACDADYSDIADKAGVRNVCETFDGYIRFLAKRKPEGDIAASVTLFGPGGGVAVPSTGGVTPGAGLEYDAEGKLQVKAGNGLGFDNNKALAVDQQTVMTEADLVNEDEVLQSVEEIFRSEATPDG